jgi:hypothetical protein
MLLLGIPAVVLAVALAVWLVWPADRITADNCERIRPGMTGRHVESLLGYPADDETPPDLVDGSVTRAWNGGAGSILVVFSADGTVVRARFVCEDADAPPSTSGWLGRVMGRR